MNQTHWLIELSRLLERFPGMGIEADIGTMSQFELWGVYRFLRHLAGE